MTTSNDQETRPAPIRVLNRVEPQPAMSGDIRSALDRGRGVAIYLGDETKAAFERDVPAEEWRIRVTERTWGAGRPRVMTLLIPEVCDGDAQIMYYRPAPDRDRAKMARHDWTPAESSPNPGLLTYWISDRMTAVSVPMMVREGVRHNFWRRLFVELNDAPDWLKPMHRHNDPGMEIAEERELIEELRRTMRR